MLVEIKDKNAIYKISPLDISGYIKSKGAKYKCNYRDVAKVWDYKNKSILIPIDKSIDDYSHTIATAITRISEIEERSQISVYNDLKNVGFDIIRVANKSENTINGTLLLEKSYELIKNSHDMFFAAACSAATGKLSYASRKPQVAELFMKEVRMGQTEHGSYVITMLSPVVPDLSPTQIPLSDELVIPDIPYELKVVPTLSLALSKLPEIAMEAAGKQIIDPFIENASNGITSNLCDSIVGMHKTATDGIISISISFSRNRKTNHPVVTANFDDSLIPIFKSASEYIKCSQPQPEQIVRGVITDLHREKGANEGRVTIFDTQGNRPRAVSILVQNAEYERLTEIHKKRLVVELEGTIEKLGNRFFIKPTSKIEILDDPPSEESL